MIKSKYKLGLIIQGAVVTYGQGPNNCKRGFNAIDSIMANIIDYRSMVDCIVLSTWKNQHFNVDDFKSVGLDECITSIYPPEIDHDNRLKQFISTMAGVQALKKSGSDFIIKIRTDQVVPAAPLIEWILSSLHLFNSSQTNTLETVGRICLSEYRSDTPFYAGDFIFAGWTLDIERFCRSILDMRNTHLHPCIGVDYILKYYSRIDDSFNQYLMNLWLPIIYVSDKQNSTAQWYWELFRSRHLLVIPKVIFTSITWRGRLMTDILSPNVLKGFSFHEDLILLKEPVRLNHQAWSINRLRSLFKTIYYEFTRYFRAIIKHYIYLRP